MWTQGNFYSRNIKSASANKLTKNKHNINYKKSTHFYDSPLRKPTSTKDNLEKTPDLTKNSIRKRPGLESLSANQKFHIKRSRILAESLGKILFRRKNSKTGISMKKRRKSIENIKKTLLEKPAANSNTKNCVLYIEQLVSIPLAERKSSDSRMRKSNPEHFKTFYEKPKKKSKKETQTNDESSIIKNDTKNYSIFIDSLEDIESFPPYIKPRYL